jgi:hypothetical protein
MLRHSPIKPFLLMLIAALLLGACSQTPSLSSPSPSPEEINPTETIEPTVEEKEESAPSPTITETQQGTPEPTTTDTDISPTPMPTTDIRPDPENWQAWPIVPIMSENARTIYKKGLAMGNRPDRFSKVGDCQNITTYYLSMFDDPDQYKLGPDHDYLQTAIDHFSGSFSRESLSVSGGMNVAAVLSPVWADNDICETSESPLACELRVYQPSIALVSMEESWGSGNKAENYEKYMRQVIETLIEAGTVPILATKADNVEGDHQINQTIVQLAYEYDIPLWNFWAAVQPLPHHGLLEDGFHLTHGINDFSEAKNLKQAWPMRNLTALKVIDAAWRQLNDMPWGSEQDLNP